MWKSELNKSLVYVAFNDAPYSYDALQIENNENPKMQSIYMLFYTVHS